MRALIALLAAVGLAGCSMLRAPRTPVMPPYAANGCWAEFFAGAQYRPPSRSLVGPSYVEAFGRDVAKLSSAAGATAPQPRFEDARSLLVGPHARVIGYAEPLFRGPVLRLGPGEKIPDLASMQYRRVHSLALECSP